MKNIKIPSVFYENLRSFTTVAETLNITKAVDQLGFTRQTIRRHLDDLEAITGEKLFDTKNRQYQLTTAGQDCLAGAKELLAAIHAWAEGNFSPSSGLQKFAFQATDSHYFYHSQQHSLYEVWDDGTPILKHGLRVWTSTKSRIEDPAFASLKPYLLIFRKHRGSWLCTHVGNDSSFATWMGQAWAQSAVGKALETDPDNMKDEKFTIDAYDSVSAHGCPRYDHIYAHYASERDDVSRPVAFQRLLVPLRLPDGEPVLGSLVTRTNCIRIDDIVPDKFVKMPQEHLMEFEIE